MSEPISPSIIYPNGNEVISNNQIVISWYGKENSDVVYDIFFTDNYVLDNEPDWQQITTVPSSSNSYKWSFGNYIRTSSARIAIRARNSKGERGDYSISASNFSINRKKINSPTIISPVPNGKYDKFIEIIMDDSSILGNFSQRNYYQVYYSNPKIGISKTSIAQNVPVGSDPIIWNTVNLQPSSGYEVEIYLSDSEGNTSDKIIIKNITISHDSFFIVDTEPPVASVSINSNKTFTKNTEVSLNILSYDRATGNHSMIITDGTNISKPDTVANVKRFILDSENGIKYLQVQIQDFGGNRCDDDDVVKRLFEIFLEEENSKIVDLCIDKSTNTVYAISTGNINGIYKINKFPSLIMNTSKIMTAISYYKGSIYIAVDSDKKGVLSRFDGSSIVELNKFSNSDSIINSFCVYNDLLFLGTEDGRVYTYDGLNVNFIQSFNNPIKYLYTDNNLLYLVQKNNFDIQIYNGIEFFLSGE